MRIFLFLTTSLFLLLTGCADQHERAEKESVETLEAFFSEMDHNELIIDSDDLNEVMRALDNRLGEYLSGNFLREIENEIRQSFKKDRDYTTDPETFTFFLTNSGDGFRFAKGENISHSHWLSLEDEVVGSVVYADLKTDLPEWPYTWQESATITMMKLDGTWKIDEVSYANGALFSD